MSDSLELFICCAVVRQYQIATHGAPIPQRTAAQRFGSKPSVRSVSTSADGVRMSRERDQYDGWTLDWMIEVPHTNPPCKHGRHDCDACGTHDERDFRHTTIGGRGVVARIRRA
ncbi:MAG TPA: hypothetical protein VFB99_08535 [Vicinamibacterales bacterium]|nr:hypothetical protein [Vicinamibacterales bacterium]